MIKVELVVETSSSNGIRLETDLPTLLLTYHIYSHFSANIIYPVASIVCVAIMKACVLLVP